MQAILASEYHKEEEADEALMKKRALQRSDNSFGSVKIQAVSELDVNNQHHTGEQNDIAKDVLGRFAPRHPDHLPVSALNDILALPAILS